MFLADITVVLEHRGEEARRQLLSRLVSEAYQFGWAARLEVFVPNPAWRLYRRLGGRRCPAAAPFRTSF